MKKFVLDKIENLNPESNEDTGIHLVKRLYDLGLHPGLEIEVVSRISFNAVVIIQFGETRLALNEEEFACLHGY